MFKELFTEAKSSSIKDLQKAIKKNGQVLVITGGKDTMVVIDSIEDGYAYGIDQFDKDVEIDLKKETVTISESKYPVYHSTYTSAINAAEKFAKTQGYDLDPEELATEIGMGPGKPKGGKTVKHSLGLFKNGAPIKGRKRLQIQVYDRGQTGNRYELNAYIS